MYRNYCTITMLLVDFLASYLLFPMPLACLLYCCSFLIHSTTPIYPKYLTNTQNREHIAELNNAAPKQPFFFLKPPSSILAPGAGPVLRPKGVSLHYEIELGLVMGRQVRDLDPDDEQGALDSIECLCSLQSLSCCSFTRYFLDCSRWHTVSWELKGGIRAAETKLWLCTRCNSEEHFQSPWEQQTWKTHLSINIHIYIYIPPI